MPCKPVAASPAAGTLGAGINMPARSTIISRMTDKGAQLLPHNERLSADGGECGQEGV
jgi:superfamily II RNA helicase